MSSNPWFEKYPKGVAHEIDPDKYDNIPQFLEASFQKYKEKEAYECFGKSITYNEVDVLSKGFAAYLQNKTVLKKGDRVIIQMPNLLQYPVVMFGVLRAGLIVVNTNPLYTEREMIHQFDDSGAKAIIVAANFADKVEAVLSKTAIKYVFTTQLGDMLSFPKKQLLNFVVKNVKKMVPKYSLPQAIDLMSAVKEGCDLDLKKVEIKNQEIAFLQYTGGTTGVSKGAMLTHRNLLANMLQTHQWMQVCLKDGEEIIITALPLYHIFAMTVNCLCFTHLGAKSILITNPRDMEAFLKEMGRHKFSVITGVNTLFNGMMNHPLFAKLDFSHLKVTMAGGMALQRPVAERWEKITKNQLLEGYGLTEASPVTSCNPLVGRGEVGTIGLPFPSTMYEIHDDEGNVLPQGEIGEICIKGPQIMKGYWEREDETRKTITADGFLKTGDIGAMREDGYFYIVDRKKDMICVSGFNVYPNEIEEVVAGMPKVLECAAVGIKDDKSTEAVKLFVVKNDPTLTEQEIIDYCKENLTGYKRPKCIEFKNELPKSNVGKILRRHLRDGTLPG